MPKAPTTPPKTPLEPKSPTMPPPASLLEQLADSRDRNRIAHRAKAQVAKVGKTASTCLLTGLSASAATELGANGQQMESMDPSSTSVDLHQIAFTFLLAWFSFAIFKLALFQQRCTASAVIFGSSGVLPTSCVEHFLSAPVTAPAGFVAIKTQLIEFTTRWQTKEKEKAKHPSGIDAE